MCMFADGAKSIPISIDSPCNNNSSLLTRVNEARLLSHGSAAVMTEKRPDEEPLIVFCHIKLREGVGLLR